MKFIATTIVLLASTAVYAGESNLRLGRDLKKGNKNIHDTPRGPKAQSGGSRAMAYGARCCRNVIDETTCNNVNATKVGEEVTTVDDDGVTAVGPVCSYTDITDTEVFAKFQSGFSGCTWNVNECIVCEADGKDCGADTECCSGSCHADGYCAAV